MHTQDAGHWCRVVMDQATRDLVVRVGHTRLDALEISGVRWQDAGFKSYETDVRGMVNLETIVDLMRVPHDRDGQLAMILQGIQTNLALHYLGASGLIMGYFGFLVARGLLERTLVSLAIAAAIGFYYGGLVWQVIPRDEHVSWQTHLFGLLSGLVCAWLVARKRRSAH